MNELDYEMMKRSGTEKWRMLKIGETGKPEKSPKNRHILHRKYCPSPRDGIFALSWGWDLGNLMTSGAMLAVVYSTDRASHARQVQVGGWDMGLTTPFP